jgi:hypothetical protein
VLSLSWNHNVRWDFNWKKLTTAFSQIFSSID